MTVTRALRPGSPVAETTRAVVLAAVERLGYHPRPNLGRPRSLSATPRRAVEVILGDHRQASFSQAVLAAVSQELAVRNRDCVLRSATGGFGDFLALCECMRADREMPTLVLGWLPTRQLEVVLEVRPNAILVDHTGDPLISQPYHSIGFDNIEAARLATRHLLEIGRRRILLLGGFAGHYFTREVAQGHREALAEYGLAADPALIIETDNSLAAAAAALAAALDGGVVFDAVLTNDDMAVAVLGCLRQRGLAVPGEVAVAGIDGLPVGAFLCPALTTASLDYAQLGRLAAVCVCDEAELPTAPLRRRLLPRLIIRNSTKET
jgi:LacI family transcriptional regulator